MSVMTIEDFSDSGILLTTIILLVCVETAFSISCRNEHGKSIDWYVNYKLPELKENISPYIKMGTAYTYANTSHCGKWTLSDQCITSTNSMVGLTLEGYYKNRKSITYLLYNDENPDDSTSSSKGHTKGIIAFDKDSGFWLIHSIPKFPPVDSYKYPHSALEYGQSILCVTFRTDQLNKIGKQLLLNEPDIYGKRLDKSMAGKIDKDVRRLFKGRHKSKKFPNKRKIVLKSKKKMSFTSFAKNSKFDKDLYSDLIAPALKTSLETETWRRGEGGLTPSSCGKDFTVTDVEQIEMTLSNGKTIHFESLKDHSKWAVADSKSKEKWICIGDINRMDSQHKRGGGSLCFQCASIWKMYNSAIKKSSQCKD